MLNAFFRSCLPWLLALLFIGPVQARDLQVVVSIKPVHSLLSGLLEGVATPVLLVDGAASPWQFRPDRAQKRLLENADLVVWTGVELEPLLAAELKHIPARGRRIELLDLPEIKLLPSRHDDDRRDPWFWLDSRNMLILLDVLTHALIDIDPVRTHLYVRNRSRMLAVLSKVDRELEYGYRGMKAGVGYLYYDSLQYFEQAYALKIRGLLLDMPWQTPDTARLLKAHAALNSGEYRCLLAETDVDDEAIRLLAGDAPVNIGRLDSLGRQFKPGPQLYARLMRYNTRVIKDCLEIRGGNGSKTPASDAAPIGDSGHFILLDQNGKQISDRDMRGKYQLIYFGYTSCPDVCPMSLHVMLQALKRLGPDAEAFQPYFISIDPERDTVPVVREYVRYFDRRLIGLTGSSAMIRKVAGHYHIRYEKVIDDPNKPQDYRMDHTSGITIIDPQGRFVARLASNITPSQMSARLREILE